MKHTRVIEALAIVTLPMVFAVACTTNGEEKKLSENDVSSSKRFVELETDASSQLNNVSFVSPAEVAVSTKLNSVDSVATLDDLAMQVSPSQEVPQVNDSSYMLSAIDTAEVSITDEVLHTDMESIDKTDDESFVKVKMTESDALKLLMPEKTVFNFAVKKHDVTKDDYAILEQHALYLMENPRLVININGYSDSRGSAKLNYELSAKRAQYVADVLLTLGVSESQMVVNGYGESFPVNDESNWDENRRVELLYIEQSHHDSLMMSAK